MSVSQVAPAKPELPGAVGALKRATEDGPQGLTVFAADLREPEPDQNVL